VMWQPGQIVPDTRYIPLNENASAGGYRLALAVYEYPGLVPLQADTAAAPEEWTLVGQSAIGLDAFVSDAAETETIATIDPYYELADYEIVPPLGNAQPGENITVSVDWRVTQVTPESYINFVHLLDAEGNLLAQQDVVPFEGRFPTWAWPLNGIVSPSFSLIIPEGSQPPYQVRVGMYRYPSLENLPVQQHGEATNIINLTSSGTDEPAMP